MDFVKSHWMKILDPYLRAGCWHYTYYKAGARYPCRTTVSEILRSRPLSSHFSSPDYWKTVTGLVKIDGLWLEFGVFTGRTINQIAACAGNIPVYGFDGFQGLPEHWVRQDDFDAPAGSFGPKDDMWKSVRKDKDGFPMVRPNVRLIAGWFQDTLPSFAVNHPEVIAFLHMDCDLYSSTKTVLDCLAARITSGTIIAFDEIFRYGGFENHEMKAFLEFAGRFGVKYRWRYHTRFGPVKGEGEQAVVEILHNPACGVSK